MNDKVTLIEWLVGLPVISSLLTLAVTKMLNKKKDDVLVALDEQKIYRNLLEDLNNERDNLKQQISELEEKISKLTKKVAELIKNEKELKKLLRRWENDGARKDIIIKEKNKLISDQDEEIQKLKK